MILLSVADLVKHFGPEPVLDGVAFELRPGERIGLVGPNGTGKTTLLTILAGKLEADSGRVELHASARLGYLEQQPNFPPGRTLWEEAHDALADLAALAREAETVALALSECSDPAEHKRLATRLDRVQHEIEHQDAYNLDHKIERVLDGLGLLPASHAQPVEQLSGGQQNRLLLAKLLLAAPEVMLLDEPSNHLDIEATEWLESYLADCSAALLVVSHDRYFLDKVTNRTLELYQGTVDDYSGNFSAYWRQKAERLEVQQRTFDKQQEMIAKTEDFIRRNHYGQKSAQAEDRRKKLERVERVAAPREIAAPPMAFNKVDRSGDIVLNVEHLAKAYDRPLFNDLSFQVLRGERWGILGPNGCGKTTLLRCLVGETPPDEGKAIVGTGVKLGYYDQLLSGLDPDLPALEAIRPPRKEMNDRQRRDLLARFGVRGDTVFQSVSSLSGGERSRTALSRVVATDPNLLVLDEPTNHLDLWARDALERAIKAFEGTVLFVSHDRYFVNRVADHLLVVEPGRFRVIEGNYDTYLLLVKAGLAGASPKADGQRPQASPGGRKKAEEKPTRPKRRFAYRKVADLEAEIFERETRIEALHAELVLPDVLRDGSRVREIQAEVAEHQQTLKTLYAHWDEATELN